MSPRLWPLPLAALLLLVALWNPSAPRTQQRWMHLAFVDITQSMNTLDRPAPGATAVPPGGVGDSRLGFTRRALQKLGETYLRRVLKHFDYAGILTLEFFVAGGKLLANEMAPRVHNSGHWTIEGAETSQFENHVRAVAGLPLGSTRPRGHAVLCNLIGRMPPARRLLGLPDAHLHDYGKAPRPGRKLGHVTRVCATRGECARAARALRRTLGY